MAEDAIIVNDSLRSLKIAKLKETPNTHNGHKKLTITFSVLTSMISSELIEKIEMANRHINTVVKIDIPSAGFTVNDFFVEFHYS